MSKTALIAFDYSDIDAETKGKLISLAGSVKRGRDHYNKSVLELGESIHTAHELLANHGNGTFGKWVEMECGLEVRTAANYMHAWARFKDCEIISQFSPTSMYLLSAPEAPKAAANEAEKRAGKGERITVDKAKEILERFKQPAADKPSKPKPPKKLPSQSDQPSNGAPDAPEPPKGDAWEPEETTDTGKPVSEQVSTQRSKTVKTVEALMRAFDDLNSLLPSGAAHRAAIASCKELLATAKGWK